MNLSYGSLHTCSIDRPIAPLDGAFCNAVLLPDGMLFLCLDRHGPRQTDLRREAWEESTAGTEQALILVRRKIGREEYLHAEPPIRREGCGPMFGGNFIYTSDGRFADITGIRYPIAVHDRFETPRVYDALTR